MHLRWKMYCIPPAACGLAEQVENWMWDHFWQTQISFPGVELWPKPFSLLLQSQAWPMGPQAPKPCPDLSPSSFSRSTAPLEPWWDTEVTAPHWAPRDHSQRLTVLSHLRQLDRPTERDASFSHWFAAAKPRHLIPTSLLGVASRRGVGLQGGGGAGLTLPKGCSGQVCPGRVLVPGGRGAGQPAPASPAWSRGLKDPFPPQWACDSFCHVKCHLSHPLAAVFFSSPLLGLALRVFFCFLSPVSNGVKICRTVKCRDGKWPVAPSSPAPLPVPSHSLQKSRVTCLHQARTTPAMVIPALPREDYSMVLMTL